MTGRFRNRRALAVAAAGTAVAVAAARMAVLGVRSGILSRRGDKDEHEWTVVGRYIHRPGGVAAALGGANPLPTTVRYRWCECDEMVADVLPGVVPPLALMGFREDEIRQAFDTWMDENADPEAALAGRKNGVL